MRPPDRLPSDLRNGPLAERRFRWIWFGEAVSLAGTQFHLVALPWLTLQVSGSAVALGALLATAAVTRAALLLVGGALTDRWSARKAMLTSNIVRALLAGVLAAAVLAGMVSMPLLYTVAGLFGVADAVFHPAYAAAVPRLVSTEQLAAANTLVQGSRQIVGLVAPALAGALVATQGAAAAFAIDSATFVFAAAAVRRIPDDGARAVAPRGSIGREIMEGLAYVRSRRETRAMLAAIAAINLTFTGPFVVGAASLAEQRFGGAASLGWLLSSLAAGGLCGTMLAVPLDRRRTARGGLVLCGMLLITAALAALAVASHLRQACVAGMLAGLAAGAMNPLILSWLQRDTPAALQGRVMALTMLAALGLTPLSYAGAGFMAAYGAEALFLTASAALAAVTAFAGRPLHRR